MEKNLPHLVVTNFESAPYTTAKKPRIDPPSRPPRVRDQHSALLKQQLELAWANTKNNEAIYHSDRKGIYLEFKGEKNYELVTKSLESISKKDPSSSIRLLNIRTEGNTTFATVFTPKNKHHVLTKKILDYASENSPKGNPLNAPLIESISDIKQALEVESFWTDDKNLIPMDEAFWCEIWLSSDCDEVIQHFETLLNQQQITFKNGTIRFPERSVKIILANQDQLKTICRLSDDIAEYRRAKETAAFWLDQNNKEQAEWVQTILSRLEVDLSSDVAICILDTGVNNEHPLLQPVLASQDCHSADPQWGTHDHDKHGTLMAGVSTYGDIQDILTHDERIQLRHCLESVKIFPPSRDNAPELWGDITAQGIDKAENKYPKKKRLVCMAITSDDTRDRGRPSSWSGALDQICSGVDNNIQKLFIVSAGNITAWDTAQIYPDPQLTDSVHDPAQSWNALTVGAYTELDQIIDPELANYKPIAPRGGLSPFSTTSFIWDDRWPIKPEIVMEGGNSIPGIDGISIDECCPDLSLLSTHFDPQTAHFSAFNMTSAATAQAAWFAAQIQAEYPDYWPETIRGLMIHSADWTDTLKQQFLEKENKTAYKQLLRVCGYGVPNLAKARYSASNNLTLVAQSELQPFDKKPKGGFCTKDMHLYELPWPKDVLQALPPTAEIQMKITLSYFIEPGPERIGWKDRYRYPSHGLRFDLNSPGEPKEDLIRRINVAARDEENGHPGTSSAADHWTLGQARDKGSIHSDIWKGSAAELADSNLVAIYPTIGWWRERAHLNKWNSKTRYSLIVSINTPEESVDIYTPVAVQIGIKTPIEITT